MSLLSPHWIATHIDARDWEIMRRWQPKSLKLFDQNFNDPTFIDRIYGDLPTTLFVLRDWPLSEQRSDMHQKPAETGRRHADEWKQKLDWLDANAENFSYTRTVALGINEPRLKVVGDDQATQHLIADTVEYNVAFCDRAAEHGFHVGALSFSVGWPDNNGEDTPANWQPYTPVYQAVQDGNHYVVLHEYWDIGGPQDGRFWWADRLGQCPFDWPILVGECGVDRYVRTDEYEGHRGWGGVFSDKHLTTEEYLAQLETYDDWMRADPRVHSVQPFTYDYGGSEWKSFDIRVIRDEIVSYVETKRNEPAPEQLPFPRFPPDIEAPDQEENLKARLWAKAQAEQVIEFNPGAALQKHIFADGFVPNSPEFDLSHAGTDYRAQRAEHLVSGEVRVYYVVIGDWANVQHMTG